MQKHSTKGQKIILQTWFAYYFWIEMMYVPQEAANREVLFRQTEK
jgi:hypothetical protein